MQCDSRALCPSAVLFLHPNEVVTRPIGISPVAWYVFDVCTRLGISKCFVIYEPALCRNLCVIGCEDYATFRCINLLLLVLLGFFLFVSCFYQFYNHYKNT